MISTQDLLLVGFLAFLEGILSIDNALVLALTAKGLPANQQRRALTYGLAGAVVFRISALFIVQQLMAWTWVKYVGGGYLIFIALQHLLKKSESDEAGDGEKKGVQRSFWKTVVIIELMDIAFAVDSILAAVALTQKFWIVFVGGFIGVILIRFSATMFIKLLHRFPGFESTAYLLILWIGIKLILEALHLPGLEFESPSHVAFWGFWGLMALTILSGFRPKRS
jgi:YkoY family integral membrane protein